VTFSAQTQRETCQHIVRTLTIAIIVLLPAALFCQGYFGTVSGLLTDPSAAIIQGARITLLDEEKGYQFTATPVRFDSAGVVLRVSGDARF
jgi:hypothetical protein